MYDDDDLPPMASPLPLFAGHVLGVLTHLGFGTSAVVVALLVPDLHPAAGEPLSQVRIWLAGIGAFSTFVTVVFSTITVLACYRLIAAFLSRASSTVVRIAMVLAVFVAHGVGCGAGVVGSAAAVFGTVMGEHGNPWPPDDVTP